MAVLWVVSAGCSVDEPRQVLDEPSPRCRADRECPPLEVCNNGLCVSVRGTDAGDAVLNLPDALRHQVDAGELNVKAAIAVQKSETPATSNDDTIAPRKKKRKTREHKIVVRGFTVTVKARRLLDEGLVLEALMLAAQELRGKHNTAKAA